MIPAINSVEGFNPSDFVRMNTGEDGSNDAYLDALFDDVTALYRLDQTTGMGGGSKEDMGPLPAVSKALLITLAVTWILIGIYYLRERMRKSPK